MKNCIYCGDFYNLKGDYCSKICYEIASGKYNNIKIRKCKDKDNHYCECRACLKAIFVQDVINKIKGEHELWINAREII